MNADRYPESGIDSEVLLSQEFTILTKEDEQWLSSYGVDNTWTKDPEQFKSLNDTVNLGSFRLNEPENREKRQDVISARRDFLKSIGLSAKIIDAYQTEYPALIPLDTFIGTQRVLHPLGIAAARLINAYPAAINYAPESVREKMANYTSLGIDAAKLINAMPAAINYAPDSVREKMANYTSLGIEAVKLINAYPAAIGLAPDSVREKMANYTSLGIDAAKLVNAVPAAIGLAPKSVRKKMAFLRSSAKLLKWDHSAEELVNTYPALINFNIKKLAVLHRIAATYLDLSSATSSPNDLRSFLITPLEKYIIAASNLEEGQRVSLKELLQKAQSIKLGSSERKKLASEIAPSLGRIGIKYEAYREKK